MHTSNLPVERGVRILADDLSGALDAAGPFAACSGPVAVYWDAVPAAADGGARVALDTATREVDAELASTRTRTAARAIWADRAGLSFKKVDSVWRGSPAAEIAAASTALEFDRVIVAPAFPQQGRVTRNGGQWVADGDRWRPVVSDIASELRRAGMKATTETLATFETRALVCDAESPGDLDAVVDRYWSTGGRTLWCGTGGLARALAERSRPLKGSEPVARSHGVHAGGTILVIVGTDHPVAVQQARLLEDEFGVICHTVDSRAPDDAVSEAATAGAHTVLLRFRIPEGATRQNAGRLIARALGNAVNRLPEPGIVVATGGETVRALCNALGATRLEVFAEHLPGIPVARWSDGRWAGKTILSKSGGFGSADLLRAIVKALAIPPDAPRNR